jgi:amidophosphoribosyltransferase
MNAGWSRSTRTLRRRSLAYLGLHALQHRGQESAGIVTSDGERLRQHKSMGLVADIFSEEVLSSLRGILAIGHTRYSTAGDSALLNAQPIMVQSNKGTIGIAHNGNLVNALAIRRKLEGQGSIFQTNSDTEVLVHLIALSREQTLPDAIADALRRVEGAFSLVMISRDRIFAARDPRGFRPLAMGRIPALTGEKKDTVVFASETCAFDLIGATYERDVKPGELVIVGPEGISSRFYSPSPALSSCIFEHVYFSRVPTVWFSVAPSIKAATTWDASWRAKLRSTLMSSFPCPTRAIPPRLDTPRRAAFRFASA